MLFVCFDVLKCIIVLQANWKDVFRIVDILCCGAVLIPIIWSIKHLRVSIVSIIIVVVFYRSSIIQNNNCCCCCFKKNKIIIIIRKQHKSMAKLRATYANCRCFVAFICRSSVTFISLVSSYIFSTQHYRKKYFFSVVLNFLFGLNFFCIFRFRLIWLGNTFAEVATVVFFGLTGFSFRPAADNPYFELKEEDRDGESVQFSSIVIK